MPYIPLEVYEQQQKDLADRHDLVLAMIDLKSRLAEAEGLNAHLQVRLTEANQRIIELRQTTKYTT